MIIRDIPESEICLGLRLRSIANPDLIGTVVKEETIEEKPYFWVQWDGDNRIYSGFFWNRCDCEVVEEDDDVA